ncbi:MAG: crossover junction endodeoxyribonuclease RuvC [Candidatus Latescibacterota bacterium]
MYRILGIDPGSVCTGYGIIDGDGDEFTYVTSGAIAPVRGTARNERLKEIFIALQRLIEQHAPTHFAIEEVFYSKNVKSALVLGEARGAAVLAASLAGLPVHEYSPKAVKQAITGHGAAQKTQVSYMLCKVLNLAEAPDSMDESDALAIALCHAFRQREWSSV